MPATEQLSDLVFEDHGSIILLHPQTDAGREWVREHLPSNALHFGAAIAIEARFAPPIAEGAAGDGLGVCLVGRIV